MTLAQCITQVLAELETATQDAKARADELTEDLELLRAEVSNNFSEVGTNISDLQAAGTKFSSDISDLQADGTKLSSTISTVQYDLSDLKDRDVGRCDCRWMYADESPPSGFVMYNWHSLEVSGGWAIGAHYDDDTIFICRPCMEDGSKAAAADAPPRPKTKQYNALRGA